MSIYSVLSTRISTVAFSVIHQSPDGVQRDEYTTRLKEIRARVRSEAESAESAVQKLLRDSATRETQALRGLLSQFLQTPISSDDQEVRRLIRESLEKFRTQTVEEVPLGVKYILEGRMFFPSLKRARDKKLLQNGRSYLQQAGFDLAEDHADLYESVFAVEGGANLDVLDLILTERHSTVSPYDSGPPGYPSHSVYGLYNLLFAHGDEPEKSPAQQGIEAVLAFPRPELMHAAIRETILEILEKMTEELLPAHVSVWQQKLGLGHRGEYLMRIIGGRADIVSEWIHWLELHKGHDAVRRAIVDRGSLLVQEIGL